MRTGAELIGRQVTIDRLDTREPVQALVWAVDDTEAPIPGAVFLRRRYGLNDPSEWASVFVLVEGGAVYRAEVGYESLEGFGVFAAPSRHGFPMPDVTRGYPDSMPRLWPV